MNSFIKTFIFSSILFFAIMGGLVISVDPYDKLGINVFGFETKAVASPRENKYNMLQNSKKEYQAFILGSSSAHRFHTSVVEKITGFKTFNYSVQHATPEDYIAITRHILSKAKKPKLFLIQLDLYALNKNYATDNRLYKSPLFDFLKEKKQDNYFEQEFFDNNYFTLDALRDSLRVVGTNLFGEARHAYIEDGNYQKEKAVSGNIPLIQFETREYVLDPQRISYLKEIKSLCEENDINLIVWSSPKSLEHLEKIFKSPRLSESFKVFNEKAKELFPQYINFNTIEFSQKYNTTRYFRNSTHPTRELSDLVMEKLLKKFY